MKILFVVTAFYPEQAIGSVRITKFAKFLEQQGIEISIISLKPMPWAVRDESLHFEALDHISWEAIGQSHLFKKIFMRARNAAVGQNYSLAPGCASGAARSFKSIFKSYAQLFYALLKAIDWVVQVRRHACRYLGDERFDLILSSYPSFASPFAALALRRMGLAKTIMVDFRDPVSYGTNRRFSLMRFFEHWMLKNASLATFISVGVKEKVAGGVSGGNDRLLVLHNGFDPDDLKKIKPSTIVPRASQKFRFVYVGSLYSGRRDLTPFFAAVACAVKQGGFDRRGIELHYAGQEGGLFLQQAGRYCLAACVVDHGRVPRNESLALQQAADVCLLATWNSPEDRGILTGKMFEFFMLRKPVLAIVNGPFGNSESKRVIERTGAGICYEEASSDDIQVLISWIDKKMRQKIELGAVKDSYNEKVDQFNFYILTKALKKSIEPVVFGKRNSPL
jgi:glycosyltransferase involved in cell wall biosynthesis